MKSKSITMISAVTLLWLASIYLLLGRHYGWAGPAPATEAHISEELLGEKWMAIYIQGERAGRSAIRMEKIEGGYRLYDATLMRLRLLGEKKELRMTTDARLDGSLRVRSFSFFLEGDVSMSVSGVVSAGRLDVSLDGAGVKARQEIPLKESPYLNLPLIQAGGLKEGSELNFPVIDPGTLALDKMALKVKNVEPLNIIGKTVDATKLEGTFKGAEFTVWVSEAGEILKEESMGITLIKVSREEAMAELGEPKADLSIGTALKLEGRVPPDDISYLKVKLSGTSTDGLDLGGGYQKFSGGVLEIGVNNALKENVKESDYLSDTLFIQSKDPIIVKLAKEITGSEKDRLIKARLIYDWVFKNIKKTPAVTVPSASEVLKSRRGDCNEHATLYTALARASGVPARIAVGLVLKDGYLYYHAWPEVLISGGWLPVDPTLGRFPAGAGNIRLLAGDIDRQARLISVAGRLRAEVIEWKK